MISASGQVKHCIVGLKEQFDLVDEEVECFSGDCAGRVNERTLAWLSKAPAEPWFYYIHYMDVHHPYDAPRDWAGRFSESYGKLPAPAFHGERKRRWENPEPEVLDHVVGMYDGEIAYLDSQVGQLLGSLKARGLTDNLLIVVASDHGEELCERGGYGHGQTLYEEQTRCPLIFVWPGQIPATVTSEKPVQNVDIVPTLLDLLGVEPPPEIEGASLVPCFRGDRPALPVFSERRGVSVRQGRWKLWHGDHGIVRLFDLSGDPSESANLARAEPDTLRALQAVLTNWRSRLRPPPRPSGRPRAARPDPAALARLHTLGYHG
jgi:arylsulfatase A-like enzyme